MTGDRSGKQIFGSINYGKKIAKGNFDLTPIARINLGHTKLDSYDESGTNALAHGSQEVETGLVSLGLEANHNLKSMGGNLEPFGTFEYMFDFRTIDFESEEEEPFLPESMNSTVDNRDQAALRLAKSLNSWLHQASYIEQITSDVKLTNLLTSDENEPDHIDWDYDFDVTGTPNGQIGYLKVTIPIF